MPTMLTNNQRAFTTAAERGAAALAGVDLPTRCALLRLAPPTADGSVTIRVLGQLLRLTPPAFSAVGTTSGESGHPADRILALHYLLCEVPIVPTGRWISFREFTGGPFYWGAFHSRTIEPLVKRIGNDLELLRQNLDRLNWKEWNLRENAAACSGDTAFAARIQALGAIEVGLIYRQGDDELEATAELLFDVCAKRALRAEDAAVLASRICLSLL